MGPRFWIVLLTMLFDLSIDRNRAVMGPNFSKQQQQQQQQKMTQPGELRFVMMCFSSSPCWCVRVTVVCMGDADLCGMFYRLHDGSCVIEGRRRQKWWGEGCIDWSVHSTIREDNKLSPLSLPDLPSASSFPLPLHFPFHLSFFFFWQVYHEPL